MGEANFYFGRINFKHQVASLGQFGSSGSVPDRETLVEQILLDYMQSDGPVYVDDEQEWFFGDIDSRGEYILGKFGKVFPEQPTRYDEAEGDFVETSETDRQADYSMFIVYVPENIIIYNQRKRVGYRQFREAFSEGYNEYVGRDDALTINLLQNKTSVKQIVQNARISEAEFDLVPTNPATDPEMRRLDDHLREMKASGLQFSVSGESLNMEEDLLVGGLAMSNNGYGDYRLSYELNGRTQILTSADKPATKRMEQPETLDGLDTHAETLIKHAEALTSYEGE